MSSRRRIKLKSKYLGELLLTHASKLELQTRIIQCLYYPLSYDSSAFFSNGLGWLVCTALVVFRMHFYRQFNVNAQVCMVEFRL